MKNKYVFFDLDHTLINTDSEWEWKNMLNENKGGGQEQRKELDFFLDLHDKGKLPIEEYTNFLMQDLIGQSTKQILELTEYNFNKNIKNKIFTEARLLIEKIKNKGGNTIILSGSFKPIIEPVAKHLEINDVICTELEVINDAYTGSLIGEFCVMQGKVNKVKEFCLKKHIPLSEISFYGDSHSDIPMMKQAGHSTVVNPTISMKKIANIEGWDIVMW